MRRRRRIGTAQRAPRHDDADDEHDDKRPHDDHRARAGRVAKDALSGRSGLNWTRFADVAQLVEHQLPKLRVAGSIPVVRFSGLSLNPPRKAGFGVSEAAFVLATETVRNRLRLALTGAQLARNCAAPANRGCRVSSAPQMVAGAWTFG
jgi:hypothetical protein